MSATYVPLCFGFAKTHRNTKKRLRLGHLLYIQLLTGFLIYYTTYRTYMPRSVATSISKLGYRNTLYIIGRDKYICMYISPHYPQRWYLQDGGTAINLGLQPV